MATESSNSLASLDTQISPLSIIVIGAGIGGLTVASRLSLAGHSVTVLEASSVLREVGAGLQLSPNATRLLHRWGLKTELEKVAVQPTKMSFHRFSDDGMLGLIPIELIVKSNAAPWYNIHRDDLHSLLARSVSNSVKISLGSTVTSVYHRYPSESKEAAGKPCVVLSSGAELTADLVIGADGIKSVTRRAIISEEQDARVDSAAAYRVVLPSGLLLNDPDLESLVSNPEVTQWIGPGASLVGYPIRNGKEYNIIVGLSNESEEKANDMEMLFVDWNPRVRKLLALIPAASKWQLADREPLKTWVHPKGHVVLLGDAAHPILPFGGQGAALAIEDAAVLGNLFSNIHSSSEIPKLLCIYEALRLPRCSDSQTAARMSGMTLHAPDGPMQQARDNLLRQTMQPSGETSKQVHEKILNQVQYGYDADKHVEEYLLQEN
ncbi:hypothetical protein B0H15DRAFT_783585 [Mycena belliarum]|uniref:FAD-binding domain-containing protein n=1 Tax=Mycena belliarum TaxID=1033014 RepID=A0AAD6U178_9AGAR|nr:hypothetical protein B0H15DRAFT_783585 [Mycena belliae]